MIGIHQKDHKPHHQHRFNSQVQTLKNHLGMVEAKIRKSMEQINVDERRLQMPSGDVLEALVQQSEGGPCEIQIRNLRDLYSNICHLAQQSHEWEQKQLDTLSSTYAGLGQMLCLHLKETLVTAISSWMGDYYQKNQFLSKHKAYHCKFYKQKQILLHRQIKLNQSAEQLLQKRIPELNHLVRKLNSEKLLPKSTARDLLEFIQGSTLKVEPETLNPFPVILGLCNKLDCCLDDILSAQPGSNQSNPTRTKKNTLGTVKTHPTANKFEKISGLFSALQNMHEKTGQRKFVCEQAQNNLRNYYNYLKGLDAKHLDNAEQQTQLDFDSKFALDKNRAQIHKACSEVVFKLRKLHPKAETLQMQSDELTMALRCLENWEPFRAKMREYSQEEHNILNSFRKLRNRYYHQVQDRTHDMVHALRSELELYLMANVKLFRDLFAQVQVQHRQVIREIEARWNKTTETINKRLGHVHMLQNQISGTCPEQLKKCLGFEQKCGKVIDNLHGYTKDRFHRNYHKALMVHVGYIRTFLDQVCGNPKSEVNKYLAVLDNICALHQRSKENLFVVSSNLDLPASINVCMHT